MNESENRLTSELLRHTVDMLRAEVDTLRAQQVHDQQMAAHRLELLEQQGRDHEARLRSATDGVVQFKMWAGLTSGTSGLLSLAALVKAFLGMG